MSSNRGGWPGGVAGERCRQCRDRGCVRAKRGGGGAERTLFTGCLHALPNFRRSRSPIWPLSKANAFFLTALLWWARIDGAASKGEGRLNLGQEGIRTAVGALGYNGTQTALGRTYDDHSLPGSGGMGRSCPFYAMPCCASAPTAGPTVRRLASSKPASTSCLKPSTPPLHPSINTKTEHP